MSKNKKTILIILSILIVLGLFLGVYYAYYIKSINQEESNIVKTKCLNFSLTNEKNDINLDEQYPIPDSEGRKLTPYQFTITNTCEQFISYNVNLESLEATTMDSSAVKVMINNEASVNLSTLESTSVSIDTSKDSKILATGSLGSNDNVDYALRLWMDYGDTADTSSMNKVFESKVVVTATVGTYKPSDYVTTLHDAILVNEYGVKNLDNAISKIEAKETPDFSQTAPIVKYEPLLTNKTYTKIVHKASAEMLNNADEYTDTLTEEDSLMTLYTDYDFNESTGRYTLKNPILLDPTTIDWNSTSNNYYYYFENLYFNTDNNKLVTLRYYSDYTVYRVTKVTKGYGEETYNSKTYKTINYNISAKYMEQNIIESDYSNKGLYLADDNNGKSFYYRGNVKNNYVSFAGYSWKIIRINGDSTIRLLYNGDYKNNNDYIMQSNFNSTSKNPNKLYYVSNINNEESNIKKNIDSWYENNLINYEKFLADSGFCGDRNFYKGDGFSTNSDTYYNSDYRINNFLPSLICENKERDLYTLTTSNYGNKSLNYPIGLITSDELMLSGLVGNNINKLAFTYSNTRYFTISPGYYSHKEGAYLMILDPKGFISHGGWTAYTMAIRPVINLKADVEISGGIGTVNDPYIVKTT